MLRKALGLVALTLTAGLAVCKAPARPIVTKAQFLEIKEEETTYAQVVTLVGSPGVRSNNVTVSGGQAVMYSWENPNGSIMKAIFMGQEKDAAGDLKLTSKFEVGLK